MGEKEDFLVEKKIRTKKDIQHEQERKEVVEATKEYAKKIQDKVMRKNRKNNEKLKKKQKEKLNAITQNNLATKIQNCFKQHKERKQLNDEIKKNMLLMEDFIMLNQNNEQMLAGAFNEKKMKETFDKLKEFQSKKDKNIKILGEAKFNKINDEISNLFKEMSSIKNKNEEKDISNQPTRPSTALSGISGVSNSSVVVPTNVPKSKTNTQQIKL